MHLPAALAFSALALTLAAPAAALTIVYSTTLSNAGEPVPTSPGAGSATVTVNDVAMSISVSVTFANLVAGASAAHIHCCTATAGTGSIGVALGLAGFPNATSGIYNAAFTPATFATIAAGMAAGKAYINIHSPGTYAGGEIRGFLAPVPEPQTYALMLAGLGVLGWAERRRQRG